MRDWFKPEVVENAQGRYAVRKRKWYGMWFYLDLIDLPRRHWRRPGNRYYDDCWTRSISAANQAKRVIEGIKRIEVI